MNDEEAMEEPDDIRKFACGGCLGEFFLRDGIEPHFCPHCGGSVEQIETKDFGQYEEP